MMNLERDRKYDPMEFKRLSSSGQARTLARPPQEITTYNYEHHVHGPTLPTRSSRSLAGPPQV